MGDSSIEKLGLAKKDKKGHKKNTLSPNDASNMLFGGVYGADMVVWYCGSRGGGGCGN